MKLWKKFATVTTVATVLALTFTGAEPAFATGPTYAWQYASSSVDSCINHTSGGTAVGGSVHGQFVANSMGGGACSASYVEVVYVNNSGSEVAKYAHSYWGQGSDTCGASCAQIVLPRSSYQRILEILSSSTSGQYANHSTPGIILYY